MKTIRKGGKEWKESKKMKRVQTMMIMGRSRIKLKDAGIRQGKEEG